MNKQRILERHSIGLRLFVHEIKPMEFPGLTTGNLKTNLAVIQVFLERHNVSAVAWSMVHTGKQQLQVW